MMELSGKKGRLVSHLSCGLGDLNECTARVKRCLKGKGIHVWLLMLVENHLHMSDLLFLKINS